MEGQQTFFRELPALARPTVIALVGPNGSGKSSIARLLGFTNARAGDRRYRGRLVVDNATSEIVFPLVNADEIAKQIKKHHPDESWDNCNADAAKEAAQMRRALSEAMLDFGFETVGSHPSKVEFLTELKARGYVIVILFVTTESADINVCRVEQRRRYGGHDVPIDKVRNRYIRTMSYFSDYLEVSDLMVVYDNSKDLSSDDGQGPKLLLVKRGPNVYFTEQGSKSPWLSKALSNDS